MRRSLTAVYVFLVLLSTALTACASTVTVVKEGKASATIVIAKAALDAQPGKPGTKATPELKVQSAAKELQKYVEKMTGVKLEIVGDDAVPKGPLVLVGASSKTAGMKIPTGLTPARTEEAYVIKTEGDDLVLAGNDIGPYYGTFFAVSEFLNRQGVRWFMPSEFGEVVPKLATIEAKDLDVHDKPDFMVRAWNGNLAPELREEDTIWRLHNKGSIDFNDILAIPGDSYLRKYMPDKELIKTHPEYFAQKLDGTPDPNMISLCNPEAVTIVADKVKADIKKRRETDPTFNSLGFAPDDGIPMDLNKETMKHNAGFADLCGREGVITELSVSEEWFTFMNKVTAEVVKDYPGFIITTNGYTNRTNPPEGVAIHPQMGIMFAAIWSDLLHAYDDPKSWQCQVQGQMLKRWAELSPRVFVYNYNFPMLVNGLTPMPMTRKLARNVPLMKKWGVCGFEDEQTFAWMAHGITTFYTRAKLYWHANEDVKALLNDYFEKWYGPAAKPSQAYWDTIEATLEASPLLGHEDRILPYVYSDEMIASMEKSQQEAETLATAEPYKTHVHIDRLILDHLKAYMGMNRAEFTGKYVEAIEHAEKMIAIRLELNKISGYLIIPESKDPHRVYFAGSHYWNTTQRKEHYQKMLDMTTGKTGDLIAQSPREVKFCIDDGDLGRYGRWYEPSYDRSKWRTIDTATPFYLQDPAWYDKRGIPYTGYMWYVFELNVPESSIGKPVHVYAPLVVAEAWVWTNGQYSGHKEYAEPYIRPQTLDLDVTNQVKAGKNVIGVRVSTSSSRIGVSEGFQAPLYLIRPKPAAAPAPAAK